MEKIICPICKNEMKTGRAAIRKHTVAKMSWPFPSDRLFFKADNRDQRSETIVREGQSYEAYQCENCGALLIPQNR